MRSFIFALAFLSAAPAVAVDYRIKVDAPEAKAASPFRIASYSHEAAGPVEAKTVSLPRINLGGCPGGVCPAPKASAEVRERASETVRVIAGLGACNRPVLYAANRVAHIVTVHRPVRTAACNVVRGAVCRVACIGRRLLGR